MKNSKMIKGAVLTGALLATGLTAPQVFADEDVTTLIESNSNGATVSPAKEDTAVQDAEKSQKEAVERANEANRTYDEQARKTEDAKRVLAEKEAELGVARNNETTANNNLSTARGNAEAQSGAKKVAELDVAVSNEELKHAEEVVAKAEKEDKATQKAFEEAKKVEAEASKRLGDSESAVKQAETAVKQAQEEVRKAETGGVKAQFTKNTIVLNDDFATPLKRYNEANNAKEQQRIKDWSVYNFNADYSRFDRVMEQARKDILKVNTGVKANNTYVSDEHTLADKKVYDLNNLPREITEELSFFYAELVNQVRKQIGAKEVVVTKSAIDFAEKVSKGYQADRFGWKEWDALHKSGGVGHDAKAINRVAREYGMLATTSAEEAKGSQYYESANSIGFRPTDPHYRKDYFATGTLDQLKKFVYESALAMIGTKDDWGHLAPFVGFSSKGAENYGAMSYSHAYDFTRVHFFDFYDLLINKSKKFDTTAMKNPYTNKANEKVLEVARQTLATKVSDLDKAKKVLDGERYKAVQAQSAVSGLEQRKGVLVTAEKDYNRAKDRHASAVSKLADAEKKESELQALVAKRIEVVETAKQAVVRAEQAYNQAKAVYEEAVRALATAGANKAEAEKALDIARANLEKAKADLLKAFKSQDEETYMGYVKDAYDKGQDTVPGEFSGAFKPVISAYKETKEKESVDTKAQDEVTKAETVEKQASAVLKEQESKFDQVKKDLDKQVEDSGLKDLIRDLDKAKEELEDAKTELSNAKSDEEETKKTLEDEKTKETAEKAEIARLEAEKAKAETARKEAEKAVEDAKKTVATEESKVEKTKAQADQARKEVAKGVFAVPGNSPVQEELPIGIVPVESMVPKDAPVQEELPIGIVPVESMVPKDAPVQEELPAYPVDQVPGIKKLETQKPKTETSSVLVVSPQGQILATKEASVQQTNYQASQVPVQKQETTSAKVLPNTGSKENQVGALLGLVLSVVPLSGLKKRKF